MSKAFTMIELIFIIVIIGILAAIAIPKLSATSKDARGSKIAHSLSVCITEAGVYYMKNGTFGGQTQSGGNQTRSCEIADKCFDFTEYDNNGSLKVEIDDSQNSPDCIEAQNIAKKNLMATRTHVINF